MTTHSGYVLMLMRLAVALSRWQSGTVSHPNPAALSIFLPPGRAREGLSGRSNHPMEMNRVVPPQAHQVRNGDACLNACDAKITPASACACTSHIVKSTCSSVPPIDQRLGRCCFSRTLERCPFDNNPWRCLSPRMFAGFSNQTCSASLSLYCLGLALHASSSASFPVICHYVRLALVRTILSIATRC